MMNEYEMRIAMLESEVDDQSRLIRKLRAALQEIYAKRGEDNFISEICSPLIDESR